MMRIVYQITKNSIDGTGGFSELVLEAYDTYEEAVKKIAEYYIFTSTDSFYVRKAYIRG
jgi:hypothetical protein